MKGTFVTASSRRSVADAHPHCAGHPTDRLVGATSVGPMGGEVLSMCTLAVHAEIPVATLRSMVYAYPTFHRTLESALDSLP